jgi:hypothetical protein
MTITINTACRPLRRKYLEPISSDSHLAYISINKLYIRTSVSLQIVFAYPYLFETLGVYHSSILRTTMARHNKRGVLFERHEKIGSY